MHRSKGDFLYHDNKSNATWELSHNSSSADEVSTTSSTATFPMYNRSLSSQTSRQQRINNILSVRYLLGIETSSDAVKSPSQHQSSSHQPISLPTMKQTCHPPNVSKRTLIDEAKMQRLLAMLRSDKFVGSIDPRYHTRYLYSPEECSSTSIVHRTYSTLTKRPSGSHFKEARNIASSNCIPSNRN
jgi:hypothetical protein